VHALRKSHAESPTFFGPGYGEVRHQPAGRRRARVKDHAPDGTVPCGGELKDDSNEFTFRSRKVAQILDGCSKSNPDLGFRTRALDLDSLDRLSRKRARTEGKQPCEKG
jgi:hypothetical protein